MNSETLNANITTNSATDVAPASSSGSEPTVLPRHPRKRIVLSEHQLQAILRAARATGNDDAYRAVQAGLSRSCTICRDSLPPRVQPPDANLFAQVTALRARLKDLVAAVAEKRERVPRELSQVIKTRLVEVSSPHMKSPQTRPIEDVPTSLPSATVKSASSLAAIVSSIRKSRVRAAATERRARNVRIVLQKLKDDAADNPDADVSQTINADWTVNVNEHQKRTRRPSFASSFNSPIPTHRQRRKEDSDDAMLSPFVTPRSKTRRLAARCLRGAPPLQLDMPR